jgi:RNA polymerase sigma-70 factor (sigma-E family)
MGPIEGSPTAMAADDDFVAFVSARWNSLYRLAWLLTGGDQTAEDVLQLALAKTYVKWDRIRRMAAPEAYVRRILANTVTSSSRRSFLRHEVAAGDLPEARVPTFEDASDSHLALWPLVCALPPRQRAVVVLRFYEDLTEAQVAEALGCSVGTVKSHGHDAMQAMRRGLQAWQAGEVRA